MIGQALPRAEWIEDARRRTPRGDKGKCAVCGKFRALTQAHHIYPLKLQYDDGILVALQEFKWLCPTHHVAVHQMITDLLEGRPHLIEGLEAIELVKLQCMALRFFSMRSRLGGSGVEDSPSASSEKVAL